ncbi:N-formylglutamate amidohydrolase [Paraburkholderia terricola]|uniref:N-formylglutamate amidohydrolase n=1 Tax=Paraburkholderia terricola TaxID=169427 RepID=A0ABU1M004_9BURK|nr:N-formylglutamate amidohydrolase [Paraburkholderia terricola]MDR6412351.1 N-formylglutamate amidohydrolase [Paraburkholderia terricola]MDR6449941.1 N-formylglutamate amidohydrolase [Paraburkholderia terricola]MDR6484584.1 N-formylglutamate amidohydrolase [Paraburkholderia terricola]MDR6496429.1 N-formylglutamate amidohydrolase [Paraburkholderia terricola]
MDRLSPGQVFEADSPVIIATPHTGTVVPPELLAHPAWQPVNGRLSDPGGAALLAAAKRCGVSSVAAHLHPCVIDLNVAIDSRPLSQKLNRLGLCRTHTSRGEALYQSGLEPAEDEVEARVEDSWRPYHRALAAELRRLRTLHSNIILLVSHVTSWLSPFREQSSGSDCNAGTNQGNSCDRGMVSALTSAAQAFGRSWVVNGKFADAFAAQHYGMPESGVHVIELEVSGCWRTDCELWDGEKLIDEMSALIGALEQSVRRLPPAENPTLLGLVTD